MSPDGSETRVLDLPEGRVSRLAISPDEKWLTSGGLQIVAIPLDCGNPVPLCAQVTWGADGRSILFHYNALMGDKNVSVQVPCKPGTLPALPPGGLSGPEEAARFSGARVIPSDRPAAATDAVYASVHLTFHSNIFRVTLP